MRFSEASCWWRFAVVVAAASAVVVSGFELSPSWLGVAGRNFKHGGYLWRPQHPVNFDGHESVAVTVSLGPAECTEHTDTLAPIGIDETDSRWLECPRDVLFSGDGGLTVERARGISHHFCGGLGSLRNSMLYCPGKRVATAPPEAVQQRRAKNAQDDAELKKKGRKAIERPLAAEPVAVYEEREFRIVATADSEEAKAERRRKAAELADDVTTANGVLMERPTGNYVTFDQSVFDTPIEAIRFGGGMLRIPERQVQLRNMEVRLGNGSALHVVYRSTDGGSHWEYVSTVPVAFGRHSTMMRMSDTRVLLISGEIGAMNQTSSLYLGTKWEKVEPAPFVMPSNNVVSRYFTTVATGVVPRPSLGFVGLGTKKNSQRSILLSSTHNDIRDRAAAQDSPDLVNYTQAYMGASTFDCIGPDAAGDDEHGCATSGFVAVVEADHNGTILVFYDQLRGGRGFRPAAKRGDHVVYAMRIFVNETAEKDDYDARVLKEEQQKAADKRAEEEAVLARERLRKKREEDKAAQRKRNRARRQQWLKDDEVYKAEARRLAQEDGQYVVIRPVDEQTVDLEREMF